MDILISLVLALSSSAAVLPARPAQPRKDNAIVVRGTVAFSKNGKTRTVTTSSTDAKGKRVTSVAVYDRE